MVIKAIIFDFGGIIVNYYNMRRDLIRIFKIRNKKTKELMVKDHHALEKGKITTDDFSKKLSRKIKVPHKQIKQVILGRYATKTKLNLKIINLIKKLKKNYRVALLSNSLVEHARFNRTKGRYKYFRPVILSYQLRLRKPNSRIYRIAVSKLGIKKDECLFIDDEEPYIRGAKKVGIPSLLFKNLEQLKKDLLNLGIKL